MNRYAIVGFGCAGYNAAKAIRSLDVEGIVDVYERTVKPPFNPMLTTYYASERLEEEAVFPFGNIEEILSRLNVNLINDCSVTKIHTGEKKIVTDTGIERTYDKILISTGARAFIPSFLRCERKQVFLMRTLEEARNLRKYLDRNPIKTAAVVGGSMAGIKVAELLYRRGIQTEIIDAAPYLFPLAAHEHIARKIERRLEKLGIGLSMNKMVEKISERGVEFSDGSHVEAELVCLCVGTRANVELLSNTDLVKDEDILIRKGIVIDSHGMTSCKDIYAAGDCCEGMNLQSHETAIIGLWANASMQGACAGKNMAGMDTEYYGNILHNITHFLDMDFIGLGNPGLEGEMTKFEFQDFEASVVMKEEQIQSINILGNYSISGILKNFLIKKLSGEKQTLSFVQRGILEKSGLSREFIELIGR